MTNLKNIVLGVAAATAVAAIASSAAAVTTVSVPLTPTLPGTITGSTTIGAHTKLVYTFTVPTPYKFTFERDAGIVTLLDGGYGSPQPFQFTLLSGNSGGTVNYTLTTAVPEASTWAMMLVGVAGVGGMMRRRATVAAA